MLGYNGGYSFIDNGFTDETLVGLNSTSDIYGVSDTMSFSFAAPVSAVGAVLNWAPNVAPVTISAYDVGGSLLESFTLSAGLENLAAPNSFYGFQRSSADIASFRLTDGYVAAIGGLSVSGAVPEPATWAMMILGFGAVGGAMRRRQSVAAKVRLA